MANHSTNQHSNSATPTPFTKNKIKLVHQASPVMQTSSTRKELGSQKKEFIVKRQQSSLVKSKVEKPAANAIHKSQIIGSESGNIKLEQEKSVNGSKKNRNLRKYTIGSVNQHAYNKSSNMIDKKDISVLHKSRSIGPITSQKSQNLSPVKMQVKMTQM